MRSNIESTLKYLLHKKCYPDLKKILSFSVNTIKANSLLKLLKNILLVTILYLFSFSSISVSQNVSSALYEGKLIFNFNVDTAYVQFGLVKPSIKKIANGDTLIVSNGFYHLFLSYPTNEDHYITRNVLKDSTYTINYNFDLSETTINLKSSNASLKYLLGGDTIILSDEDTKIFVDEEFKAKEYYSFFIESKTVTIQLENEEFDPKELVFKKKLNQKIDVKEFHFYSSRDKFPLYALLPGMSYLKVKNYGVLALVTTGYAVSSWYFVKYQREYSSMLKDYNVIRDLYLEETNERRALELAIEMKKQSETFSSINNKRNAALYGILGVVALDVINKVKLYKKLETRDKRNIDFFIEPKLEKYLSLGASINF